MEKELREKEYTALRDEILKWQDRRMTFTQIAITLVTAYTGYMLSIKKEEVPDLSWQIVSIFPLMLLTITIHIIKIFELFQIRASTFLSIFYNSIWETEVGKVSLSEGKKRVGYNRSMAIIYVIVAVSSTVVFILKYPHAVSNWETILFAVFAVVFILVCRLLYYFGTNDERKKFIERWTKIKNE